VDGLLKANPTYGLPDYIEGVPVIGDPNENKVSGDERVN
jgi:hypothetical protein